MQQLRIAASLGLRAQNGGLFISRGVGIHPDRCLSSAELIVVASGTLSLQEGTTPYRVHAGETLLLAPNTRHFGTTPYDADLRFYWFHFSQQCSITGEVFPLPKYVCHFSSEGRTALHTLCHRFLNLQEGGSGDALTAFRLDLLLLEMLAEVATSAASNPPVIPPDTTAVRLAHRADALLRVRYDEPKLSTQTVADALGGVNPDYLGRVYRVVHGKPITDALHEYRLRQARAQLLHSEHNISEIARACGFADVAYFRRVFKRHNGTTPQGFRRLHARLHINTEYG